MKRFYKSGHGLLLVLILILVALIFGAGTTAFAKNDNSKKNDVKKEKESEVTTEVTSEEPISIPIEKNPSTAVAVESSGESCLSETFQVPSEKAKPVDVLFVLETSPSMNDLRQKIIDGISQFVTRLPSPSDFNIAVMLAHGSTSSLAGKLYQAESEPLVLKTSGMTKEQILQSLNSKISLIPVDTDAGGGEEGVYSLFRGITAPDLLAASQTAGFFRADAALSVVFVADRRDICAHLPAGVPEEQDPAKVVARFRDCEGLTAAGLVSRLLQLKGSQSLLVSGLIYTRDPVPVGKEIGYGYTDVIQLSKGRGIDLAHDDINEGLFPIIELGGQTSPGQNIFNLAQTEIDPASVKVTVNDQEVSSSLDNSKVIVNTQVPQGATVVVSYCLKAENPFVGLCEIYEGADQWNSWEPVASLQDVVLQNRSGNHALGAIRNLMIQNVSGKLQVESAMNVSSISSVSGNSQFRVVGDIGSISDVNGSFRIDKAGHVGAVSGTKGNFQMNAVTLSSYSGGSGNACVRAESIGKIESMNGNKTFIAAKIEEISAITGEVHVYGAEIQSVTNTGGKICLHNGARVLTSTNVTGFIGVCP